MKQKRINHQVDNFCEIFSGWKLVNDLDTLIQLKEGKIDLYFISKVALIDGKPMDKEFHMLYEISDWFDKDLADNNINKNYILRARLKVMFVSTVRQGKPKSRTEKIVEVKLIMEANIQTDKKEYKAMKNKTVAYHYIKNNK